MSDLEHRTRLRVRYADTDQMGVVYHANYLQYFDVGRTELLRSRGVSYRELEAGGLLLAVVDVGLTYHGAAFYDDELEIRTCVTEVRKARIRFEYAIHRDGEARPITTGHTVLGCLGPDRRPTRPPAELWGLFGA